MIAYLDPGTGSIVLQVIVGGFAGLAVFFKMFGRRLMFWKKDEPQTTDTDLPAFQEVATAELDDDAEPATVPPAEANS
jgi:hypothetical protein